MNDPSVDFRVLHALRVRGHASVDQLADRLGIPGSAVDQGLLDREARGLVARTDFAGERSWSLTEAGKRHGEALLATELDDAGARAAVEAIYERFLPLNDEVAAACGEYQLTTLGLGETNAASAIERLRRPARHLVLLEADLVAHLPRFQGYAARFTEALDRAASDPAWITAMDRDPCHRTWFELHEDLIATLGLSRT